MNTKTKALLVFGALFIAGFASGFLFHNAIAPEYAEERLELTDDRERWQQSERPERSERARNRLSDLLDLTPGQRTPFFEMMSEYRSNLRSEMREMRNRENELIKVHYESLRNDLSDILSPEQLEKMDSHFHPDSVRHHRMRGGRPGQ